MRCFIFKCSNKWRGAYCHIFTMCSLYVHYMFTICSLHVHFMFTSCSLYVHYTFTVCSLHVHYIFTICSLYVHYMFTICSLHVHYMFTICSCFNIFGKVQCLFDNCVIQVAVLDQSFMAIIDRLGSVFCLIESYSIQYNTSQQTCYEFLCKVWETKFVTRKVHEIDFTFFII